MRANDYDYDNDNDNEPPRDFCTAPLVGLLLSGNHLVVHCSLGTAL